MISAVQYLKFLFFPPLFSAFLRRIIPPLRPHTETEVMNMTSKELLYVEDALGHEKYFQTKCREAAGQIQDQDLKACVEQMEKRHQRLFQSFYGLL